jgi:hypothetical protein
MGSNFDRRGKLAYGTNHHFSGASGSRSMTYFPRATLMIGAPGILLGQVSEKFEQQSRRHGGKGLPNTSFEVTIVSGNDINTMLNDTINQTVIRVRSLVVAFDSLKSWVFSHTQGQTVFLA